MVCHVVNDVGHFLEGLILNFHFEWVVLWVILGLVSSVTEHLYFKHETGRTLDCFCLNSWLSFFEYGRGTAEDWN